MNETTDVKQVVSGEQTQETGVQQPKFSETPASPTSALAPEAISALSQALKPIIEEAVERKLQSTKDKRFSLLEKGEGVMKDVLASLKQQGVALPPHLEQEFQIREYIDQRLADRGVTPASDKSMSAAGAIATGDFNVVSELQQLGLSTGDPDVAILLTGQYRNADHWRAEAAKLALRKAKPSTPSETVTPAPIGGSSRPAEGAELVGEYRQKMLAARGNKALGQQIKEEYRKRGCPVDTVVFGV